MSYMSVCCPYCGKDNPEAANYCENCGKKIIPTPKIKDPDQLSVEDYQKRDGNLINRIDWFWVFLGILIVTILVIIFIFYYDILFKPLGSGY